MKNILISRTDAIGDVVLSLPITGILKNIYPDCKIYFLGQTYTKEIIESCVHVDEFIDWNEIKKLHHKEQINYFKHLNISIAIHVYPNIQIAWLLKKASIPTRIGTSRRWYHWFLCNHKISFSRHRSNLHESQLNLNLLIPLGFNKPLSLNQITQFYGIKPPQISEQLSSLLDKNRFNLILHPKSRGNGKEWGLDNFSKLIDLLDPSQFNIIITGTQNEHQIINTEIFLKHQNVIDLVGKISLNELIGFISKADGLIASGTGPLHLAAATGIHSIGLFPPIRPVFSKRWAPVGINAKAFDAKKTCVQCNKNAKCDCLRQLNPSIIASYLKQLKKVDLSANQIEYQLSVPENKANIENTIKESYSLKGLRKNYRSNESLYQKAHILISLDKINKPNCGLGRVAIDFSTALSNLRDPFVEFTYLVNGSNNYNHLNLQFTRRLRFLNRLLPANFGTYDILHKLHQSPSFKISGAKKSVITIHDLNFLFTKSKSKAKDYLKQVQQNVDEADAVVFISKFTKEICFQHLNIAPTKTTKIIYNGVELPNIAPEKPIFLGGSPFLFSIGQFLAKKNFHVLLPFIALLPKNVKLIVAGENNTPYGSYVRKSISDLGLEDRVLLPGPISEKNKLYLYQHCEAFVFPSLAEGFGLPIIEAMRCSKPVFCSDKTSLKEIGDKYVYFWESFEPKNMLNVFEYGMSDFSEDKKERAFQYSMQYTWQKNAEEYLELYKSLLNEF